MNEGVGRHGKKESRRLQRAVFPEQDSVKTTLGFDGAEEEMRQRVRFDVGDTVGGGEGTEISADRKKS